jgi:hypothetical protein
MARWAFITWAVVLAAVLGWIWVGVAGERVGRREWVGGATIALWSNLA